MRFSSAFVALVAARVFASQEPAKWHKRAEDNSNLVYATEVIGGTASYTTVVPISTYSKELFVSSGVTRTSSVWVYPYDELFTTVTTGGSQTTELASVLTTTSVSGVTDQVIWISPVPPTSTPASDKSSSSESSSTPKSTTESNKSSASSSSAKSSSTAKSSSSDSSSSSAKSSSTAKSSTTAAPGSTAGTTSVTSTTSSATSSTTVTVTSASTTSVASISGVTTNTKITTTDSSGSKTVIPVLFGCSFCGGGGIELFGGFGPGAGVYDWPDLPQFSGLPPIDIDDAGTPSEDKSTTKSQSSSTKTTSSSSSSSSSSCTKSSVTQDLHVTCTVQTVSGESTASTTCKTVTSTITGCSLRATDTTTTTKSTGSCWTYTPVSITPNDDPSDADDTTLDSDDDSSSKKRSIAGRIEYEVHDDEALTDNSTLHHLDRRGVGSIKSFGSCTIGTTSNSKGISFPNWPGAKAFQSQKNLDSKQFWWLVDSTTCPNVAQLTWNNGAKLGKSQVTNGKQSSDHVYEKGLVSDFFTSVLGSADSSTCDDFNKVFVATADGQWANAGPPNDKANQGNPNVQGQCRLQSLYNALPNQLNLAFVGVDQDVNSMKGKFFNQALDGFPNIASTSSDTDTQTNLDIWNEMGMALDFLKQDIVMEKYQVGNAAIFGALNQFDQLWSSCGEKTPLDLGKNYQSFMSKLYETNLPSIAAKATAVSQSLVAHAVTTDAGGDKNNFYTAIQNLEKTYPVADMTFPTASYLSFPATTDANIKRDATACSATATASTSGTASASASGTATASVSGTASASKSASASASASASVSASASGSSSSSAASSTSAASATSSQS